MNQTIPPFDPAEYEGQAIIVFSYDDGLQKCYRNAIPEHLENAMPASFAIIAGRLEDEKFSARHMTKEQVGEIIELGFDLNSHGMHHKKRLPTMSPSEVIEELAASKRKLERIFGVSVNSYCIPYSATDREHTAAALEYYPIVRGLRSRMNPLPLEPSELIASFSCQRDTKTSDVIKLIDGAVRDKKALVLMLHGVVEDGAEKAKYEIHRSTLREIIQYANARGRDKLLPVSLSDLTYFQKHEKPSLKAPAKAAVNSGVIASTDGYMITKHLASNQPTDKLLISFGGLPSGLKKSGFGTSFALGLGCDAIYVAQRAGSQYQELSLEDFVDAVLPHTHGKDVLTYGSSLGAYCSIYYGGAIDARIISSAPKNSAHPSMRKKRFEDVEFRHKLYRDNPRSSKPPLILYDPHRSEERNFIDENVREVYPDAHYREFPFAGHTVLATMQHSGVLKNFVTSYIFKNEIVDVSLRTEDSYIWHAEKARYYRTGNASQRENKISQILEHAYKSMELEPNQEALQVLITTLRELGRHGEVASLYKRWTEHSTPIKLGKSFHRAAELSIENAARSA